MAKVIDVFIQGAPCTTNNKVTRDAWKAAVRNQTSHLGGVSAACKLRVEFRLASEAYTTAPPFGSDLDNLLKPFMDALRDTVLFPHGDACVLELHALKVKASDDGLAGAALTIEPVPNP